MSSIDEEIRKKQAELLGTTGTQAPVEEAPKSSSLSDLWESARSIGKALVTPTPLAKPLAGIAVGVGEAINPLAAPRGLEVLGRAVLESGSLSERFDKAAKEAVIPEMRVGQIAPVLRTGVRSIAELATLNKPEVSEIYRQEKQAQKEFEKDIGEGFIQAGEVGSGVISLAQLVKQLPAAGRAISKSVGKAFGSKSDEIAKTVSEADKAFSQLGAVERTGPQKILREMTGPLAPQVEEAIMTRPQNVLKALTSKDEASKVFKSVEDLRENLSKTRDLIGESVGDMRRLLGQNNTTRFDTSNLVNLVDEAMGDLRLASGVDIGDPKDFALLEQVRKGLTNPTAVKGAERNYVTVGDTVKIMNQLEKRLKPFWEGSENSVTLRNLNGVWQELDSGLAQMYTPYKQAKTLYEGYINSFNKVAPRIQNTGAEGFLANIFGANKTELQNYLEDTLKIGKEASAELQKLSKDISTGSKAINTKSIKIVDAIRKRAEEFKVPEAKDFLNDLADKIAARRLASLSDKDADEIDRLVTAYVRPREGAVRGAAGTLGGFLGLKMSGPIGGAIGGYAAQQAAGSIANTVLTNRAKEIYNVKNVLKRIAAAEEAPSDLKTLAKGALNIAQKAGDDSVEQFLKLVPMNREWANTITRINAAANLPRALEGEE